MPTCVISQPRFFPGLHYLHRMLAADVFVILDTVQFNPRHEENRARLRTAAGADWLTVPMRQASREQLIRDTRIDNTQLWQRRALNTLHHLYGKAPHFKEHVPAVQAILEGGHETLTDLDHASWEPAVRLLGISCRFVRASQLPVTGKGPQLLLGICKHVGADTYLSGAFGREYLDTAGFAAEGVQVAFHEYTCRPYAQRHDEFVPFLSYLDALFNVGLDRDRVLAGAGGAVASAEGEAVR
jgi:hypothetical protein